MATFNNTAADWMKDAKLLNTRYVPVGAKQDTEVYYNSSKNAYFYIQNGKVIPLKSSLNSKFKSDSYITVTGTNSDVDTFQNITGTVTASMLKDTVKDNVQTTSPAKPSTSSSSSSSSSSSNANQAAIDDALNQFQQAMAGFNANANQGLTDRDVYEMVRQAFEDEKAKEPKKKTAQELVDEFGYQYDYDYDNILAERNEATNQYYDDYARIYDEMRTALGEDTWRYANRIQQENDAANRYKAGTWNNRGTQAANALATNLGTQYNVGLNDYDNLQQQYANEAYRQAELADNPNYAQNVYNAMGSNLLALGTNVYESDVTQAINRAKALASDYVANRQYQASAAQAYAQKYSGLASASIYNAQAAANRWNSNANQLQNMYDIYLGLTGNSQYAASMLNSQLKNSAGMR